MKRQPIIIEHNGVPMSLREYAEATSIPYSTLRRRWRDNKRGEQLTEAPDARYSRRGNWEQT